MKTFLLRNGPPTLVNVSYLTNESRDWKIRSKAISGNHSRLTSSDTVWPNGCSESESKSGISSYWTVRKGGPEAQQQDIATETKQRANNTSWSHRQSNPLSRFTFHSEKPKAHTAWTKPPCLKVDSEFLLPTFKQGAFRTLRHNPREAGGWKRNRP